MLLTNIKHGGNKPHGFRLEKHFNLCVISLKLPHIVKVSPCCSATSTWLWEPPQDFQCKWQNWKKCHSLPSSVNCHPNLRESCKACPSKAAWCINFLGIQPTFTHVPPRPERKEQNVDFTSAWQISNSDFMRIRVSEQSFFITGLQWREIYPMRFPEA